MSGTWLKTTIAIELLKEMECFLETLWTLLVDKPSLTVVSISNLGLVQRKAMSFDSYQTEKKAVGYQVALKKRQRY